MTSHFPDPSPPKASSVTEKGEPTSWKAPRAWRSQVAPDGTTRLVVSVPPEELPDTHLKLIRAMGGALSVAYMQLTDRKAKKTHPVPVRYVGLELPAEKLVKVVTESGDLIWYDGRHQFWVRGSFGEQVVLDELGMLYCYPDDPAFRDALIDLPESPTLGMDGQDYVKVHFRADADAQETAMIEKLSLVRWGK